jgi:CDP-diacylglycerol--serine O-phosphatidyltransferase
MTKHLPNFVTLLNLFSGCVAVIFAVQGHLVWAAYLVCLGIIFDFLDGFLARVLDARSELGLELDSLADLVTSGVVPGMIMYQLLALSLNVSGELIDAGHWSHEADGGVDSLSFVPFLGLLIPLASAYRLAKFNLDTEQQYYFKGLPTPANALLILSLPLILEFQNNDLINSQILNPVVLVVLTLLSSVLLNAPMKLFALKFKSYDLASNSSRYLFLFLSLVLLIILQFAAIPLIILLYIVLSLLMQKQI